MGEQGPGYVAGEVVVPLLVQNLKTVVFWAVAEVVHQASRFVGEGAKREPWEVQAARRPCAECDCPPGF